jgi:hypothetical protein
MAFGKQHSVDPAATYSDRRPVFTPIASFPVWEVSRDDVVEVCVPQLQNVYKGDYVVYEDSSGGLHVGWITRTPLEQKRVLQGGPCRDDTFIIWEDAAPRVPVDSYVCTNVTAMEPSS